MVSVAVVRSGSCFILMRSESAYQVHQGGCSDTEKLSGLLLSELMSYLVMYYVNGSGKVILGPHHGSNHHQNLIISRGTTLAHAYHVWSTCVNAFVSLSCSHRTDKLL